MYEITSIPVCTSYEEKQLISHFMNFSISLLKYIINILHTNVEYFFHQFIYQKKIVRIIANFNVNLKHYSSNHHSPLHFNLPLSISEQLVSELVDNHILLHSLPNTPNHKYSLNHCISLVHRSISSNLMQSGPSI